MSKPIVKVNRRTSEAICSLTYDQFQLEAEVRYSWDVGKRTRFGHNNKTEILETDSYIYLYVCQKNKRHD